MRNGGVGNRLATALQYEDEDARFLRLQREQEAAKYLWFNSFVKPDGEQCVCALDRVNVCVKACNGAQRCCCLLSFLVR